MLVIVQYMINDYHWWAPAALAGRQRGGRAGEYPSGVGTFAVPRHAEELPQSVP